MSETQNEYETEHETDAEPTPGTWEQDLKPMDGVDGRSILGKDQDGNLFVIANVNVPEQGLLEGDWRENARLIAAAGTAAQEAREMGYDPVAAVEALPELLVHLEGLILCLNEAHLNAHPEGHMQGRRYGPSVDKAKNTLNALASVEGSKNEE